MDYTPYLAAIVISAIQIFCHNGDRERLKLDHPELSSRDYGSSNIFMVILLISEIIMLVTTIISNANS